MRREHFLETTKLLNWPIPTSENTSKLLRGSLFDFFWFGETSLEVQKQARILFADAPHVFFDPQKSFVFSVKKLMGSYCFGNNFAPNYSTR